MTNVQVRNVPDEILQVLRAEASEAGRSLQQQVLSILEQHTAGARVRAHRKELFAKLDAELGDTNILTTDAAKAIRSVRDERGTELAQRADNNS
jgi:plasmid stability protein